VLGYSEAGTIAQQLSYDHPAWWDGLILVCTYAYTY
jgi:pimeloyl-ACP methyl ester carboxylesterase